MIEITFLGTSAMVPTKDRNVSSILLNYNEELILFDCGEGTQRQMNIANINRNRVKKIFITHWHGDHVAGLIGLIQTIGNQLNQKEDNQKNKKKLDYSEIYDEKISLEIFGPIGTKEFMSNILKSCFFDTKVDIKIKEFDCFEEKTIYDDENYKINAINLEHKTNCLGYSFIEKDQIKIKKEYLTKFKIPEGPHLKKLKEGFDSKYKDKIIKFSEATYKIFGKKITFILDTRLCNNAINIANESDLLICESSYMDELKDKAVEYCHLTSKDAGFIAQKSNSKKLILTHISQRYKACDELVAEAKLLFDDTMCAFDFMKIKV